MVMKSGKRGSFESKNHKLLMYLDALRADGWRNISLYTVYPSALCMCPEVCAAKWLDMSGLVRSISCLLSPVLAFC